MKTNLTECSENELSMFVYNDECLYNARFNQNVLNELIDEYFIYTQTQMRILLEDICEELEEAE